MSTKVYMVTLEDSEAGESLVHAVALSREYVTEVIKDIAEQIKPIIQQDPGRREKPNQKEDIDAFVKEICESQREPLELLQAMDNFIYDHYTDMYLYHGEVEYYGPELPEA